MIIVLSKHESQKIKNAKKMYYRYEQTCVHIYKWNKSMDILTCTYVNVIKKYSPYNITHSVLISPAIKF